MTPHPDKIAAEKIRAELPLDADIAAIIQSDYVDSHKLLLAQSIRNSKITGKTSDGYHTFDELYEHRITLFIALARTIWGEEVQRHDVWRTERHSDGSNFPGWFLLGIATRPGKQITYHLPMSRWDECEFAKKLDKAPEFDGHTPRDVLSRLSQL